MSRLLLEKGCTVYNLDLYPILPRDTFSPSLLSNYRYIECDISDSAQVLKAFCKLSHPLSILFNNAGIYSGGKYLAQLTVDEINQ